MVNMEKEGIPIPVVEEARPITFARRASSKDTATADRLGTNIIPDPRPMQMPCDKSTW